MVRLAFLLGGLQLVLVVTRSSSLFLGGPSCYQKDQKSFGGVRGGHKESRRTYGALSTFRVERERRKTEIQKFGTAFVLGGLQLVLVVVLGRAVLLSEGSEELRWGAGGSQD